MSNLNNRVAQNLSKINLKLLIFPAILLLGIAMQLLYEHSFSEQGYVAIQKNSFLTLNNFLSQSPLLQFNLTQLGDVLISFSILSALVLYAPKVWEGFLTSAILTLIVSAALKRIFSIPRPAASYDLESFHIIGRKLAGSSSLPSGHSMATFVVIGVLLYSFWPKSNKYAKIAWSLCIITIGFIIAFSRVGVGAHYPLDVIIGSILGFMIAIIGIFINNKVNLWGWISNRKYLPIFIVLFIASGVAIVDKILKNNLFIYYLALMSLVFTVFLTIKRYVEKKH